MKKTLKKKNTNSSNVLINTKARSVMIIPEWVGYKIGIHNGMKYIPILIKKDMIGYKLGEFSWTKKPAKYTKNQSKTLVKKK